MKRFFAFLLLCSSTLIAAAQITHTSKGAVDQNAETILKKASDKISSGVVSFNVTMVNKDANKKETARMQASVTYSKGKYHVSFKDNEIYCDGTATWHWNKESNEVVVNKITASEDDLMNPALILTNYKKNFKSKYIRQEQNGNAIVDLTPKKSKSYYKIRLTINAKSGIIQSMELYNYDSSRGEYTVSKFNSSAKGGDDQFTFPKEKYPNVEIIDMR
ncbi:MAG: outer membrane lipoprotein carrier protein LolA [Bacteroidales bacterium]|nr:outer membrane lipoprotein carrier protein LolA [Bacteroidales bacterium]